MEKENRRLDEILQSDEHRETAAARKKKPANAQDRVVRTQLALSFAVLVVLLGARYLFPEFFAMLAAQYEEFITQPPVWDLDGARKILGVFLKL